MISYLYVCDTSPDKCEECIIHGGVNKGLSSGWIYQGCEIVGTMVRLQVRNTASSFGIGLCEIEVYGVKSELCSRKNEDKIHYVQEEFRN